MWAYLHLSLVSRYFTNREKLIEYWGNEKQAISIAEVIPHWSTQWRYNDTAEFHA